MGVCGIFRPPVQGGFNELISKFLSSMILYNHPSYFKSGEINSCRLSPLPTSRPLQEDSFFGRGSLWQKSVRDPCIIHRRETLGIQSIGSASPSKRRISSQESNYRLLTQAHSAPRPPQGQQVSWLRTVVSCLSAQVLLAPHKTIQRRNGQPFSDHKQASQGSIQANSLKMDHLCH